MAIIQAYFDDKKAREAPATAPSAEPTHGAPGQEPAEQLPPEPKAPKEPGKPKLGRLETRARRPPSLPSPSLRDGEDARQSLHWN
jgi:hypothetical protein